MNFDFGEVLTCAGQITWKHKVLWLFSALPTLLGILIVLLVFLPLILSDWNAYAEPPFVEQPLFLILFFMAIIFISLLSFALYVISSASVTFGVLRAEGGAEKLEAVELFKDSQKYWLRVLGVMLLTTLVVSIGFFIFFACLMLFGVVTMGLGFICIQPLIILFYPLMLVFYGIVEEALAAAIADELDVIAAIQRGWELVKANFWRILLISLIVYFAIGLLNGFVVMPFMFPFFFASSFMNGSSASDMRILMLITAAITLLMIPLMALVQGVGMTFLKAAYAITYLRLTRPKTDAPIVNEANA